MTDLNMPNNKHSVMINKTLLVGASKYDSSLDTLNIVEGSELKFSMLFFLLRPYIFLTANIDIDSSNG
jgi:hypothetical protein